MAFVFYYFFFKFVVLVFSSRIHLWGIWKNYTVNANGTWFTGSPSTNLLTDYWKAHIWYYSWNHIKFKHGETKLFKMHVYVDFLCFPASSSSYDFIHWNSEFAGKLILEFWNSSTTVIVNVSEISIRWFLLIYLISQILALGSSSRSVSHIFMRRKVLASNDVLLLCFLMFLRSSLIIALL